MEGFHFVEATEHMAGRIERVAVGEARLAYLRTGRHSASPLVLLHGYVGSAADWDGVIPELATGREVIAYDHRGHGDSTKFADRAAYTFDLLTADLSGFLDALGLDRVDLLGHSMGGVVAQKYTLAHPDRVRSLILMDTSPAPSRGSAGLLRAAGALVGRWGMTPIAAVAKRLTKPAGSDAERSRQERQLRALTGVDPAAFLSFGQELGEYPSLRERLAEIRCPTTVLVGERDRGLHRGAIDLKRGIQGARLVVIRDAGHTPQTDRPAEWLAAVREHLDHLGSGTA